MNLRPAISAPLPWLTIAAGRLFGKRGAKGRLKLYFFPRSLKFTKFGRNYVIALIILGTAAINTGNNLLYLVSASLMSLIVISGILSESTLKKLSVDRSFTRILAYKGMPFTLPIRIKNSKKRLPSYSFSYEEIGNDGIEAKSSYVLKLEAAHETTVYPTYVFKRRGYITLDGFRFKTSFPFGLFTKGRTVLKEERVLVYPAINPINETDNVSATLSGSASMKKKSFGTELYGLRDYTTLDDARHIHWKASAKSLRLVAKEYQEETEKKILVVFENFGDDEKNFEDNVDKAASLVSHYSKKGYRVALRTLNHYFDYGTGHAHYETMMYELALIEPSGTKGTSTVTAIS